MLVSMCNVATTVVTNDNYLYQVLVYSINITSKVGTNDNYFYYQCIYLIMQIAL